MRCTHVNRTPWLLLGLLPAACSRGERPETLADLGGYDGGIEIRMRMGEVSRTLEGSLTFDRAAGRLRFDGTVDGRALVLVRQDGKPPEREDAPGQRNALGPEDEGVLAWLLALVHAAPDADAVLVSIEDGYRVTAGEQVLEVLFRPRASDDR
ncbi:MAG: hypothetical protein RL562_3138 [Planctomycetota bacterium]